MMITWLVLSAMSLAGAPEREERSFPGSGAVDGGNVSEDGSLVSFVSNGQARVISTRTWQEQAVGDCTVTAATPVPFEDGTEVWVGCSDGTIQVYTFDGNDLVRAVFEDGSDELSASADGADVVAMHANADVVYAILDGDVASLVTFDPQAENPAATPPVLFNWPGFTASTFDGFFVHVGHNQAFMSSIQVPGNAPQPSIAALGLLSVDDLAPTSVVAGQPLAVDRGRAVAPYNVTNRGFIGAIITDSQVRSVGVSTAADEWLVVAYEDEAEVYDVTAGAPNIAGGPTATFDVDHAYSDIVVTSDGYALAGATDGTITVLSDRPLASIEAPDLVKVVDGDTGTLEIGSDRAGAYVVQLGGDPTGGGTQLATGEIDAGGTVEVPYTVDATWPEGDIDVFVRITDQSGQEGHAWAPARVDAAPSSIDLSGAVGFDDQRLNLRFTALDTEDVETYTVYLSDQAFEASDYPSGGPAGPEGLSFETPIVITDFTAGAEINVLIRPLVNGTTYYLAVRATDAEGKEGPMSDVVTGRPRNTQTASERAGDPGGAQCSGVASGAAWLGGLGLGLVALRRRRWLRGTATWMAALMVGVALASVVPAVALAADDDTDEEPGPPEMSEGYQKAMEQENKRKGDLTDAWGNAEMRLGFWSANEPAFEDVFGGPSSTQLDFQIGPQIYRVVELDFGAGLVMRNGETIAEDDGEAGGTETRLMIVPLSVGITPRLHILDEQVAVPYASLGVNWWLWREREGDADAAGKLIRSGSHFGWHWELGINLLLDTIDRRRASLLEAQAGINDSWVTLGFRRQMDTSEGFDFGGDMFHVGLKLDF